MPGAEVLRTDRLILREFTMDDADELYALYNDAEVMLWINKGEPVSRDEIVSEDLPAFLSYYQRGAAYGFWAAIERSTGRFLGWFHFRPQPGEPTDDPELGYRLHRFAWGQGYATEASQALIDRGFAEHGVRRVHAETMTVHGASRRVMEKVGMRLVRTFHADWPVHIPGDEEGDVEYAIDRSEWEATRGQARSHHHRHDI